MNTSKFDGYKVAFGCFIVMFIHLGFLASVGVFIPSISSDLGLSMSSISLVVTFATASAFICSLFATKLIEKISAKKAMLMATVICALHYVVFGFAQNIWFIYVGGLMSGAVMGFGTNVASASVIAEWFIDRRSTIVGLVFGGAGFGSAFAMFVAGLLIESFGWRNAYFILAVIILVLGIGANLFLIKYPADVSQKPLGWEKQKEQAESSEEEKNGIPLNEARESPTFYLWWLAILFLGMMISGYTSFVPTYWQEAGMSHLQSSNFVSLLSFIGAISVMASGAIAEKFGTKIFMIYSALAYAAGTFLLVAFPNNGSAITILTVVFVAIAYPTSNSIPATITSSGFGDLDYAKIMAQLATAGYLGKALLPIMLGQTHKATGSLVLGFTLLGIFAIVGLTLYLIGSSLSPYKGDKLTNK